MVDGGLISGIQNIQYRIDIVPENLLSPQKKNTPKITALIAINFR